MRLLPALAFCAACGLAVAQAPMYRSTMPDGKKIISERPMPGALKVEELKVSPGNYAPGSPAPKAASTDKADKADKKKPGAPGDESTRRANELAAAEAELKTAQAAYDTAVANAAKGREETPGDRVGTAKGGARVSEEYEKRQRQLQDEVTAAENRLSTARRRYNDAR